VLTVRELLSELDVDLVAGEGHLDVPVRWVHISELADPTPFLSGGELLITTGMALIDEAAQREYVDRLADHGLAGMGLGTGFAHDAVPPALVERARERGFPVFEVPYEVPFIQITEKAFTRLVNEQYALLQRSIAAQERLQRIVLRERGLDAIVGALSALVGGAALVFDARGELEVRRTFRRELDDETVDALSAELHDRARRGDGRAFVPAHPDLAPRALVLPVGGPDAPGAAGAPVGAAGNGSAALPQVWLAAIKDGGALAEIDRLILHQAVTVVALELLRRRVADSTERRLAGDVLSAVIAGELEGPELQRRLEPFGLGGRVSALVAEPRGQPAVTEGALADALRAESVSALVATPTGAHAGHQVCALLPGFLDDELFELAERVVARAGEALGARPVAGAGRAVPAGRAREAYHEARCALEARGLGGGPANGGAGPGGGPANGAAGRAAPEGVATYRDLGSFQLLLSLQDSDALRLFCDSLLGPITAGDGHYGGELMRSLEAFIECNGHWEAAARRLYCHRHTLRYRIRKIEELTGRDLGSARDRIEFWLALRGRELVRPSTTPARSTQ
jgi:purine catabolism regulator